MLNINEALNTNIYTPNDKTSKIYEAKTDKIEEIA